MNAANSRRRAGFFLAAATLLSGCGEKNPPAASLNGQALASTTCTRCHTLPDPAQLSPEEWPYLLEWMGTYVGYPPSVAIDPRIVAPCFVPPKPLITRPEFDAIQQYFLEQSAVQYKLPPPIPKPPVSTLFEPVQVVVPSSIISMVAIDPVDHSFIIGTSKPATLVVSKDGDATTRPTDSEPVTYERLGNIRRVALLGDLGHDAVEGQVLDINVRDGAQQTLVSRHPRIAAHCTADIDGDGKDDLVVCGFGGYPTGRVAIWWGGDKPQEQVLLEESGAVWCDVADLDGDGKKDIIIAIGSNKPRIMAFVNQGGRRFMPRTIVERHVGWGYNRCLLVDWDGDGKKDIVECCGNNLELRGRPLKPWHGVRVLHNDGDWKFHEVLFEPLPGAIDVAAGDFDGNGHVDLAVTAFFPDWREPFPVTLLLLMQKPDGTVERAGIDDRYWNRWMRIAAGDAEGNGSKDLIIGAAEVASGIPQEYADRYLQLLQGKGCVYLLRNRTKH